MTHNSSVRVRIAPSPTGYMHVGTLWIALYNWLFARQNNGVFIMRIEDTDQSRIVEGIVPNILKVLHWAGLDPDEGPQSDGSEKGECGPYIQSKRLAIYKEYAQKLLENGNAYWCDCSESKLKEMRGTQQVLKTHVRYNGHCRDLNLKKGQVIRLKVPHDDAFTFSDLIRDNITISGAEIDDQILIKSDGFPTYHLAVVVDDHLMGITHVIRGEEWIASTPKHILLYQAFGFTPPVFAHMPLLLNPDRSKLSKRHNDVSVEEFIQKGYLPEALINFLALQGFNPSGDKEIYTREELVKEFDITKINHSGSVVNYEKLDWFNGYYIRQKTDAELGHLALHYLPKGTSATMGEKIAALCKERLTKLSDITSLSAFIFELPPYDPQLLIWKKSHKDTIVKNLNLLCDYCAALDEMKYKDNTKFEDDIKAWIGRSGLSNGEVLWPLRVALTGLENSPPPFAVAVLLGKSETVRRLKHAQMIL